MDDLGVWQKTLSSNNMRTEGMDSKTEREKIDRYIYDTRYKRPFLDY